MLSMLLIATTVVLLVMFVVWLIHLKIKNAGIVDIGLAGNAGNWYRLLPSIAEALRNEDREFAESRWSDALSSDGPVQNWGGVRFGNRLVD